MSDIEYTPTRLDLEKLSLAPEVIEFLLCCDDLTMWDYHVDSGLPVTNFSCEKNAVYITGHNDNYDDGRTDDHYNFEFTVQDEKCMKEYTEEEFLSYVRLGLFK